MSTLKPAPDRPLRVMVTRPAHQADFIVAQLAARGVDVIRYPTIVIDDLSGDDKALATAKQIPHYQLIIFISANAVSYGMQALDRAGLAIHHLPTVAAIGKTTAAQIKAQGVSACLYPRRSDSEALLELLDAQAIQSMQAPASVLIVRGLGGKEILAQGLRARGLKVDYLEVYRRRQADSPPPDWQNPADLIMVTSRENLHNLYIMAGDDKQALLQSEVLLGSATMCDLYTELGFNKPPIIADSPLDKDMLTAFELWQKHHHF